MKTVRSLLLAQALGMGAAAVVLTGGAVSALAQSSWQTVEGANGSYSASLPAPATQDTRTYQSNNGPVVVSSYRSEAGNGHWAAGTITYEKKLNRSADQMLDDVRNGVIARSKGTLASEKPVSTGGAPGRELVYAVKNEEGTYHVRQRFYIASPSRIVQLAYVGAPGTENGADVSRFMESVKVTRQ